MVTETSTYRTQLTSRLRLATEDLAFVTRGLNEPALHYRPGDDEWSIHEHLSHIRDIEQEVYLPLLRWATVPDMLDPLDYSRKEWHDFRYYVDEPIIALLNGITRIRDEELAIFRDMSDATFLRWRDDSRWGPLTCQWVAQLMYRHALDHLQGVMALRQDLDLEATRPPARVTSLFGSRP